MWAKPELFDELQKVNDALFGKSQHQRFVILQHNKLFLFSERFDPPMVQKHLASSERRRRKQAANPKQDIPPDSNECPATHPMLNPSDAIYLFGALCWTGPGRPPSEPESAPLESDSPVFSIMENQGLNKGRVSRFACRDAAERAKWQSSIHQVRALFVFTIYLLSLVGSSL
jgi:hypothetical protein